MSEPSKIEVTFTQEGAVAHLKEMLVAATHAHDFATTKRARHVAAARIETLETAISIVEGIVPEITR